MKKILSVLLAVSLAFCLSISVFAAGSTSLCYSLSVNGENEITAKKGDVITVQYVITANTNEEQIGVSTAQNELLFDTNFFELVSGSNRVENSLASFVSTSTPVDGTKQYVYFNWTSDLYFDKDTPVEIGSFRLKVIGSSGSGMVTNNNYLAQDSSSALFGAEATDLKVTIEGSTAVSVSGVSLNNASAELKVGDATSLSAAVTPSNAANKSVSWTSSNSSVAVVDGNGTVTAKGVGTATITVATVDGNKTASCTVTVTKDDTGGGTTGGTIVAVTGVKLGASTVTLKIGESKTLTATVEPSNATNQNVTWSSSDNNVATVDETGKITAKAAGKATITAKTVDGEKTASCEVTVKKPIANITVSEAANGSVSIENSEVSVGDTVVVKVKANSGYEYKALSVIDEKGSDIALNDLGNGRFSFKMPEGTVSVSASFGKLSGTEFSFVDVKAGEYYYDAVQWAAQNGITSGVDATHFAPDIITTRAQMVTFLWRAAGCPEPATSTCAFTDVKADTYYYKAVLWAVENGITKGTSLTAFSPDMNITRGQTVTFLFRFEGSNSVDSVNRFTDVRSTDFYYDAVLWASAHGITQGTSATTFAPSAACTRGQIVTFLYRDLMK